MVQSIKTYANAFLHIYQSVTRPEILDESESGNTEFVVSSTSPSPGIIRSRSRRRFRVREFKIHGLVSESESGNLVLKNARTGLDFQDTKRIKSLIVYLILTSIFFCFKN